MCQMHGFTPQSCLWRLLICSKDPLHKRILRANCECHDQTNTQANFDRQSAGVLVIHQIMVQPIWVTAKQLQLWNKIHNCLFDPAEIHFSWHMQTDTETWICFFILSVRLRTSLIAYRFIGDSTIYRPTVEVLNKLMHVKASVGVLWSYFKCDQSTPTPAFTCISLFRTHCLSIGICNKR